MYTFYSIPPQRFKGRWQPAKGATQLRAPRAGGAATGRSSTLTATASAGVLQVTDLVLSRGHILGRSPGRAVHLQRSPGARGRKAPICARLANLNKSHPLAECLQMPVCRGWRARFGPLHFARKLLNWRRGGDSSLPSAFPQDNLLIRRFAWTAKIVRLRQVKHATHTPNPLALAPPLGTQSSQRRPHSRRMIVLCVEPDLSTLKTLPPDYNRIFSSYLGDPRTLRL